MINLFCHDVEHIRFEASEPLSFRILCFNISVLHVRVDSEELLRDDLHLLPRLESFLNERQYYVVFESFHLGRLLNYVKYPVEGGEENVFSSLDLPCHLQFQGLR